MWAGYDIDRDLGSTTADDDDELEEKDETFTVQLSNATNATISDSEAITTISANDMPPTSFTLASLSTQNESLEWQIGALLGLLVGFCWWSSRLALLCTKRERTKQQSKL